MLANPRSSELGSQPLGRRSSSSGDQSQTAVRSCPRTGCCRADQQERTRGTGGVSPPSNICSEAVVERKKASPQAS